MEYFKVKFYAYKYPESVGWLGWFDVFKINFDEQNEPEERYFLKLDYYLHYENELSGPSNDDPADWWK